MKIGRNDPCPCGSGEKYKRCHLDKKEPAHVYVKPMQKSEVEKLPLLERNRILLEATRDIFGFARCVTWQDIKQDISGDQVRELYRVVAGLWPLDTNLENLVPEPGNKLRALYLGDTNPELLARNVFRFSLYADEIFIVDPFHNPQCVKPDYNPMVHPDDFKADTLKLVLFINMLEPWIQSGFVTLLPDPGNFDYKLRLKTLELARERCKDWIPQRGEFEQFEPDAKADYFRTLSRYPKEDLEAKLSADGFDPSKEGKDIVEFLRSLRKRDPLTLDQEWKDGETQFSLLRTGANLEMALYICQLTGAFPYTYMKRRWNELLGAADNLSETGKIWTPLTNAFQSLEFKFLERVDMNFAKSLRDDGRLESFRAFMRRIWNEIGGELNPSKMEELARCFHDELTDEHRKAQAEWEKIDQDLVKWAGVSAAGGLAAGVFSPMLGLSLGSGAVISLILSHLKRKTFRKVTPMSVFVDLARKK